MPKKGFKFTKEMLRKRRKTNAERYPGGYKHTKDDKIKISEASKSRKGYWTGKKMLKETKQKMSLAQEDFYKNNPNTKRGFQKGHKVRLGMKHNKKTKKRISLKNIGKVLSVETRKRMSAFKQGIPINKWKEFISFEPYATSWTETLRRAIRERDDYTCQLCSKYGIVVHHIDYNKKNNNPNNLITLCKKCHNKTNSNRKKWTIFFQSMMNLRFS